MPETDDLTVTNGQTDCNLIPIREMNFALLETGFRTWIRKKDRDWPI